MPPIQKTLKHVSLGSPLSFLPAQPDLAAALDRVRVLLALTGTGLAIAMILSFQQFLLHIYMVRWQMALLFSLISLMVALLLGQYLLGRNLAAANATIRWSTLSSLTIACFGIGIVICILTTTPPLT